MSGSGVGATDNNAKSECRQHAFDDIQLPQPDPRSCIGFLAPWVRARLTTAQDPCFVNFDESTLPELPRETTLVRLDKQLTIFVLHLGPICFYMSSEVRMMIETFT